MVQAQTKSGKNIFFIQSFGLYTQKCIDIYKQGFIKQCLSKLSTWNDCSMDNRQKGKRYDWSKKKEFRTKLNV